MYEKINKASYIKHQKKNFDSLKNIAESFNPYTFASKKYRVIDFTNVVWVSWVSWVSYLRYVID